MCIRDRGCIGYDPGLLLQEDQEALLPHGSLAPVSYTHLDVYKRQQESRTANIETSPRRGTIYDRNGYVLATSVDATTIYANPYEVTYAKGEAKELAEILGGDAEAYEALLTKDDISFVYIKRKADVEVADRVKELKLAGIYFLSDTKREYPYGQIGGQVIGTVNIDGEGLTGLEPVSYTHLDVYKRQMLRRISRQCPHP